jgi:hypothetical protein
MYKTAWNGASHAKALTSRDGYTTRSGFAISEIGSSGDGLFFTLNLNSLVGFTGARTSACEKLQKPSSSK